MRGTMFKRPGHLSVHQSPLTTSGVSSTRAPKRSRWWWCYTGCSNHHTAWWWCYAWSWTRRSPRPSEPASAAPAVAALSQPTPLPPCSDAGVCGRACACCHSPAPWAALPLAPRVHHRFALLAPASLQSPWPPSQASPRPTQSPP